MTCIHIECTRYGSTSVKRRRSSQFHIGRLRVRATVFNATFNNISVISRLSVLLVEETGVFGEIHWLTKNEANTNCCSFTEKFCLELHCTRVFLIKDMYNIRNGVNFHK